MDVTRKTLPSAAAKPISLDSISSSPPSSPPQSSTPSERGCNSPAPPAPRAPASAVKDYGAVVFDGAPAGPHAKASAKGRAAPDGTIPTRKKPGPKKKEDIAANPHDAAKPVKEKKTRKPRDPNAPPRKRQKLGDDGLAPKAAHQPNALSSSLASTHQPLQTEVPVSHNTHVTAPIAVDSVKPAFSLIGKYETEQKPNFAVYGALHHQPQQQQTRPQSSGQRYDPIRSASLENALLRNAGSPTRLTAAGAPNARASPSIASLIDHPSAYTTSHHHNSTLQLISSPSTETPTAASVTAPAATASIVATLASDPNHSLQEPNGSAEKPTPQGQTVPIRGTKPGASQKPVKPETPPNASSPKPLRQKEAPPPLPMGSGLLSNLAFGAKPEPVKKQYAEVPNQCIVIEVPMTQETGNYVNFIREVENKYGFDVAHPRLAEHRRRMAQMAAAGAALEPGLLEGEDMPVDESDMDSNVEMGGMEDDSTAAEGVRKKKTRKPRANEYDKNDDFIDDTEQMWEEQAMASNNGYFVWSGPLVQESARPADEKPDGTVSKRGRGRGRGGSTRGETSGRGRGRGGRGSRGDGTTRKPRITKAERAKLEIEKQERENYAATAQKSAMQAGTEA